MGALQELIDNLTKKDAKYDARPKAKKSAAPAADSSAPDAAEGGEADDPASE